jgi:hypothetical protein
LNLCSLRCHRNICRRRTTADPCSPCVCGFWRCHLKPDDDRQGNHYFPFMTECNSFRECLRPRHPGKPSVRIGLFQQIVPRIVQVSPKLRRCLAHLERATAFSLPFSWPQHCSTKSRASSEKRLRPSRPDQISEHHWRQLGHFAAFQLVERCS